MADSGPSLDGPAIFKNAIRSCPSSSSSTSPPGSTVTVTATAKLLSTLHLTGGEVSEENPPVKPVVAEILGQLCGYQKGGGFTPIPHCRSFSLQKQEYRELLKEVLKVAQQEQALHENGFPELWAWGPRYGFACIFIYLFYFCVDLFKYFLVHHRVRTMLTPTDHPQTRLRTQDMHLHNPWTRLDSSIPLHCKPRCRNKTPAGHRGGVQWLDFTVCEKDFGE